jgi:hypothetical protein
MSDNWQFHGLHSHGPHGHLNSHLKHSNTMVHDNTLHVVGVISNPARWNSRIRLFREWYKAMQATPNVKVYVVEIAYGDRAFEVTESINPTHLQLRTKNELWHKENMINLAVKYLLPRDWKYVCWSDTDVFWNNPGWALETIHQLQHYDVVQPWSTCTDMGFNDATRMFESFCNVLQQGVPMQTHPSQPYKYAHTGFAWACTRKFWENVRGLMEWCVVGSADHHMAWAMINKVSHSVHNGMSDGFKRAAKEWQDKAYKVTHGHMGCVKAHIEHRFHGSKKNRYYRERWQIFIDHKFDPYSDLAWDEQGLCYIRNKKHLEEEIKKYNRARKEDSIDD